MSSLEELDRKYDKIIDVLGDLKSVLAGIVENQGKIDRRLKKIEDKFAL